MAAPTRDILIEQGATFRLQLVYGSGTGDLDEDGNPVVVPHDITGCTARMQVRQRAGSDVLLEATTDPEGGIETDPEEGRLVIDFTAAQTDALAVKKAKYDLELEYPGGDVVRLLQGKVTISPNITRDDAGGP